MEILRNAPGLFAVLILLCAPSMAGADPAARGTAGQTITNQTPRLSINVTTIGMVGDGVTDNAHFNVALMSAVSTSVSGGQGSHEVVFPPNPGAAVTKYIFSQPLRVSRNIKIKCPGGMANRNPSIQLIFIGGGDGIIFDNDKTSVDGGSAGGAEVEGCAIINGASPGFSFGTATVGSQNISSSFSSWGVGDGVIAIDASLQMTGEYGFMTPPGAYVSAKYGSTLTVASGFPVSVPEMATATASIAGTTMAVTRMTSPSFYSQIRAGAALRGAGIAPGATVSSQTASSCVGSGDITGTTLTLRSVSSGSCVPGMILSGANIAFGTTITWQVCGVIYGAGKYTVSISQTAGGAESPQTLTATGAVGGIGLYTVSQPQTVSSESISFYYAGLTRNAMLVRLPAAKAFSVTTTTGSPTVKVTGGPGNAIEPGDFVWSDAFTLGQTVRTVSGPAGSQTLTMLTMASVTHSSGTGKLWVLPAGVKSRTGGSSLHHSYIFGWFFGWLDQCSSAYSPICNGNSTVIRDNFFENNIYGAFWGGDIAGASLSERNVFVSSRIADISDVGSVGSVHISDTLNSVEQGSATNAIIVNCTIGASVFIGMYHPGGSSAPPCGASSGILGAATTASSGTATGGPFWLAGVGGHPSGMPVLSQGRVRGELEAGTANNPCIRISEQKITGWMLAMGMCNTVDYPAMWSWNNNVGSVDVAPSGSSYVTERYPAKYYRGYMSNFGGMQLKVYPWGVLYGSDGVVGHERWVGASSAAPKYEWHQQGDVSFNSGAAAGASGCWINIASGANFYPSCPIALNTSATSWQFNEIQGAGNSATKFPHGLMTAKLSVTGVVNVGVSSSGSSTVNVTSSAFFYCLDPKNNAITVNLPASPTVGDTYLIKDCTGKSAAHSITIFPYSGMTVDGATNNVVSKPYGSISVTYTGSNNWSIN